jgi:hypothetical protein
VYYELSFNPEINLILDRIIVGIDSGKAVFAFASLRAVGLRKKLRYSAKNAE